MNKEFYFKQQSFLLVGLAWLIFVISSISNCNIAKADIMIAHDVENIITNLDQNKKYFDYIVSALIIVKMIEENKVIKLQNKEEINFCITRNDYFWGFMDKLAIYVNNKGNIMPKLNIRYNFDEQSNLEDCDIVFLAYSDSDTLKYISFDFIENLKNRNIITITNDDTFFFRNNIDIAIYKARNRLRLSVNNNFIGKPL